MLIFSVSYPVYHVPFRVACACGGERPVGRFHPAGPHSQRPPHLACLPLHPPPVLAPPPMPRVPHRSTAFKTALLTTRACLGYYAHSAFLGARVWGTAKAPATASRHRRRALSAQTTRARPRAIQRASKITYSRLPSGHTLDLLRAQARRQQQARRAHTHNTALREQQRPSPRSLSHTPVIDGGCRCDRRKQVSIRPRTRSFARTRSEHARLHRDAAQHRGARKTAKRRPDAAARVWGRRPQGS